ncbi:acyl-CoA oxidase [Didymella exigua CBS 183.55]|uniref:Acyl-coenzyme A oxidase n=1 Tax=Didymella exigua CBS 183.55 TaxID=1150837 RepID=A0A6A5R4L3_9PLEO|nr:acyl-CoA oxidase [Didymella exigua CBS 183.55]KAF1922622.1 acyl-CoA oxidase [Didymella exigua CBS 183.55]
MNKARAGSVDTFELTCLLWKRKATVQKRRDAFNTAREGIYEQRLRMGKAIFEDLQQHDHDIFIWITPRYNLINASPFGHQGVLFEPAIEHNGTEEQKTKWLSLARSGKILGTYCQTELGHGSFIRDLETTATFDGVTDEFVIDSPTASSAKFWPAGLGFSITHAVVMAQLIVGDKSLGPHLFIVQIRSLQDGTPRVGVKMGDIGYNEKDNGYAAFEHVRIPRTYMLMGHSTLKCDGTCTADYNRAKLSYSVMLLVRSKMPAIFAVQLAQAVTIATRYSVVREQGLGPDNSLDTETSVMSYKSQHFRTLTLVAKSYAMFFAGQDCKAQYVDLKARQNRGDHSTLASVHALCAGLKAYVTSEAADGAGEARKLCGGHGFMSISGLPDLIGVTAGGCTLEGENHVMWQQLGRYLLKQVDAIQAGQDADEQVRYLAPEGPSIPCSATDRRFLDTSVQLSIYRHRAQRLVSKAHWLVHSSRKPKSEAWNEHMMLIISASRAHIEYVVLQSFNAIINSPPAPFSPTLETVLERVRSFFALPTIINPRSTDALHFIESNTWGEAYLNTSQLDTIRFLVNELLEQLLPEAIALTDAWDFRMRAYANIMRWVEQMPINRGSVEGSWGRWVGPILNKEDRAKL